VAKREFRKTIVASALVNLTIIIIIIIILVLNGSKEK
jgi:hypothetical protein